MSALVQAQGVVRRFGSVTAVDGVSLDLLENEFFALLGPSGCGKTTLLRLIAGFEQPDAGRIVIEGRDLTGVRPRHRPVNLMFQSYALFPHMTVAANVAYGLEMERLPKAEIARRVGEVLEITALGALAKRKPDRLSGGQRQRVALARALVKRPKVLLLDEPLAALDRQLREQMQLELKRLQHEVGITFCIVTHDQEEALVMADRIALMQAGRIAQLGPPQTLYEAPASRFVAGFIGRMNFFEGQAVAEGLQHPTLGLLRGALPPDLSPGQPASLAVRPERLLVGQAAEGLANRLQVTLQEIAYRGGDLLLQLQLPGDTEQLEARLSVTQGPFDLTPGQSLVLGWQAEDSRILPGDPTSLT
ncbi:MAG: ABC transporter ATP-binding protein [Rhodospirillales bacterium]